MKTMYRPGYHHNGFVVTHALGHIRPWHDTQAIACAHAITHANQEKGGLRGQ